MSLRVESSILLLFFFVGVGLASYDETALAAPAFRVLRTMVATWLRDVSQYQNVFADYQACRGDARSLQSLQN